MKVHVNFIERFSKKSILIFVGCGWVVKFPYRTNHADMAYCRTPLTVFSKLGRAAEKFGVMMPYAIIQPCMANKVEYKVVMINGQPLYHTTKGKRGKSFIGDDTTLLFTFAKAAVKLLKRNCRDAIVDGLVRVDVMCYKGRMVVNEFESLEACYGTNGRYFALEASVTTFLTQYWLQKLEKYLL